MTKLFWMLALVMLAAPLTAAEGAKGQKIADLVVGGDLKINKEGSLELGFDRMGFGLDTKFALGHDSNMLDVDRHPQDHYFADLLAKTHYGVNIFNLFDVGVRANGGYRHCLHPHEEDKVYDHDLFELRVGGFIRHRAENPGSFGGGLSADLIYEKPRYFDLTGPVLRFYKENRAAVVARLYGEYNVSKLIGLELGLGGSESTFNEENLQASPDNWTMSIDFSVYLRLWEFLQVKPFIKFDYDWFRDVFDQNKDGSISNTEDKLQLLRGRFGVEAKLRVTDLMALVATAYAARQDDSAQGFQRYWQYGVDAATEWNISIVSVYAGVKLWSREYDDRFRFNVDGDKESVLESAFGFYGEVRVRPIWHLYAGGRVDYDRRSSRIDNRGFADTQLSIFVGIEF